MRILRIHNRYQQPGGEDTTFAPKAYILRIRALGASRLEASDGAQDDPPYRPDIGMAAHLFGWEPEIHLDNELARIVDLFRDILAATDFTMPVATSSAPTTDKERAPA